MVLLAIILLLYIMSPGLIYLVASSLYGLTTSPIYLHPPLPATGIYQSVLCLPTAPAPKVSE